MTEFRAGNFQSNSNPSGPRGSSGGIPTEIIEEIRSRVSLHEIVSQYTSLNKSGKQFLGLCPFHTEKTPSFSVNDTDGLFYCFGCGKKGTVFDFVMDKRGLTFPEVVRHLAHSVGVEIPSAHGGRRDNALQTLLRRLRFSAMDVAQRVYSQELAKVKGSDARDYLINRGLDEKVLNFFSVGYAPESWQFIAEQVENSLSLNSNEKEIWDKYRTKILIELGLLKQKDERSYDAFRNRVIFPISRSDGKVIAFGARALGSDVKGPKYLNSSESSIYSKRRTLYGINRSLVEIRRKDVVLLVEGYLDVISLYQGGITNAVATCGTSLTEEHGGIVKRLASRAILVYDGDAAGRKAAAGGFLTLLNSGVDSLAALLPDGEDPDSFIRERGQSGFNDLLHRAKPLYEYYIDYLTKGASTSTGLSPVQTGEVANQLAEVLLKVQNTVERDRLVTITCEKLGVSEQSFRSLIGGSWGKGPAEYE